MTAEQLLDLDDDSFAQALDQSFVGSRRDSKMMTLDSLLNAGNTTPNVNPVNPFETHFPQVIPEHGGYALNTLHNGQTSYNGQTAYDGHAAYNGQTAYDGQTEYSGQNSTQEMDPFADNLGGSANYKTNRNETNSVTIHPIAVPGLAYSDLNYGAAKPVMPGSIAPQFGNKPKRNTVDSRHLQPSIEANEPSGAEKDPFADLI